MLKYVAIKVNSEMTMLYWNIGKRIQEEILKSTRAEYGQEVIKMLAKDLLSLYGRGFSRTALIRMNQFYQSFQNQQISATMSHQLSWSHIVELLPLKEQNQRVFMLICLYKKIGVLESCVAISIKCYMKELSYRRNLTTNKCYHY
ncbi:MAG: DUF1016 N-terminal domain-containing protein [Rickettsia endosymbiont of Glossina mortisans submortisans]|nr:DUF1016 N-terminal domain-containing protein [Rickettsia endosymbiont of Glossina mortisans submortisans]